MKKILLMALAVSAMACSPQIENKVYNQGINIIPVPLELTQNEGSFTLTAATVIAVNNPELAGSAAYLASKLKSSTGYDVATVDGVPATNYVSIELSNALQIGDEGYTLHSSAEGVKIVARTDAGAFYGVQTLLQLFPAEIESPQRIDYIAWTVPSVAIKDEPRFAYRGVMLDVVRHFLDVDFLKKQLDVLAMYKINRFHWHLTDDQGWRIEIKKYPKLTNASNAGASRTEGDGSTYGPFFYTQEQIKEVVAYATERHIDVIPEIELPGHALGAMSAYPEYSCTGGPFTPRIIWGVEDEVFCVGKEETFQFLTDVLDEVAPLFPSQYIHIGGDECPKGRWAKCPLCQARAKELDLKEKTDAQGVKHSIEEQLQSYAIIRVQKHVTSLGKQIIGWDEILEGGLAPGAVVQSWRGIEGGIAAANMGHEVIMSPSPEGMYIDQYQGAVEVEPVTIGGRSTLEKVYNYEPIPAELDSTKHHFILGAQGNLWAEYMVDDNGREYMMYPRILALAEATWSQPTVKDYDKFATRINNAYVRLDFHNINYHIPLPEGVLTQNVVFVGDSTALEFTNTRAYPMVYTVDGSEPTAKSMLYTTPVVVSGEGVIKIATLLQSGKLSNVRSIPFEKQALAPAVALADTAKKAEITARLASGLFISKDQYANAKFGADTLVSSMDKSFTFDMNKPSLAVYEGYVELPEDGVYTLTTDMDELYIDGVQVIDNNSPKMTRHNMTKVLKALAAGNHSYKLVYNNMIKSGWPQSWNFVGFAYKAPTSTEFVSVH